MIAQRSDREADGGYETMPAQIDNRPEPDDVVSVTTRHARCVMRVPGVMILQARRRPIEFKGQMIKVMD